MGDGDALASDMMCCAHACSCKPPDPPKPAPPDWQWRWVIAVVCFVVILAGASVDHHSKWPHHARRWIDYSCDDACPGDDRFRPPPPLERGRGETAHAKVGRPYQVNGRWYTPGHQPDYDAVGVASWYGAGFNGRRTANGEVFNENAITAAHPTLPLPSIVSVTNLENGREILVRVNDRGPFVEDRIIGLSRAAARELGFERRGTARVRVRYVGPAPIPPVRPGAEPGFAPGFAPDRGDAFAGADRAPDRFDRGPAEPSAPGLVPWYFDDLGAPRRDGFLSRLARRADPAATGPFRPVPPPSSERAEVEEGGLYVQVATFRDPRRADALTGRLEGVGRTRVSSVQVGNDVLHRVMVGPWRDLGEASGARAAVMQMGFADARIVDAG